MNSLEVSGYRGFATPQTLSFAIPDAHNEGVLPFAASYGRGFQQSRLTMLHSSLDSLRCYGGDRESESLQALQLQQPYSMRCAYPMVGAEVAGSDAERVDP